MNDQPVEKPQNGAPVPPPAQGGDATVSRPPQMPSQPAQAWQQAPQRSTQAWQQAPQAQQQQAPVQQGAPYPGRQGSPMPAAPSAAAPQHPFPQQDPGPHGAQYGQTQPYPAQGFPAAQMRHRGPGDAGGARAVGQAGRRPARNGEPGFFAALFDLDFAHFVSIKFAKVLYVLGIALNVLAWIGWVVFFFAAASAVGSYDGGGAFVILGVLALLFGWVFVGLNVIVLRVVIELVVAQVRTAQNTSLLVHRES